ncbi:helix-turn-helix domain-containing protein [Nonlabens sp.]
MESGPHEISLNTLGKIASFFNVTLDELVLYGWTAAARSRG